MNLITTFYLTTEKSRQEELNYALASNLKNKVFDKIHLFIEQSDFEIIKANRAIQSQFISPKIRFVVTKIQPTYQMYLRYVTSLDDQICCISNSDIQFQITEDASRLFKLIVGSGKKVALFITRYEADGTRPLIDNFGGSHDAFVFNSEDLKRLNTNFEELSFPQNTPGIEAVLTIFFGRTHEFELLNPCHEFRAIHHHASNSRPWASNRRVPVGYTSPSRLDLPGVHNDLILEPLVLRELTQRI
jgi:hypothetical protein